MDFAVPADNRMKKKVGRKQKAKYLDFTREQNIVVGSLFRQGKKNQEKTKDVKMNWKHPNLEDQKETCCHSDFSRKINQM